MKVMLLIVKDDQRIISFWRLSCRQIADVVVVAVHRSGVLEIQQQRWDLAVAWQQLLLHDRLQSQIWRERSCWAHRSAGRRSQRSRGANLPEQSSIPRPDRAVMAPS